MPPLLGVASAAALLATAAAAAAAMEELPSRLSRDIPPSRESLSLPGANKETRVRIM